MTHDRDAYAAALAAVSDVDGGRELLGRIATSYARRAAGEGGDLDVVVAIAAVTVLGGPDAPGVPAPVGRFVGELLREHPDETAELARPARWSDLATDVEPGDADATVLLHLAALGMPPGDPARAVVLTNLCGRLLREHELGIHGRLGEAVTVSRRAVAQVSARDPRRVLLLSNAGLTLAAAHRSGGDPALLDEAVALLTTAHATARTPDDRATAASNLGLMVRARGEYTANGADLAAAVGFAREALAATPGDDPDRIGRLTNLVTALRVAAEHPGGTDSGDIALLTEATAVAEEAARRCPPGHPLRAVVRSSLGSIRYARYQNSGHADDLVAAVGAFREAVAAAPGDAGNLSSLCLALQTGGDRTGDRATLAEAVRAGREAVARADPDDPDRVGFLSNLGNACLAWFERTGERAELEEAVAAAREAVVATPPGHPDRPQYLSNLGIALQARFEVDDDLDDLDEALRAGSEAVRLAPSGPAFLTDLGLALQLRSERTGSVADLAEAVRVGRAAVEASRGGDPALPQRWSNLALALRSRYEATGDAHVLAEAVDAARHSVTASRIDDGRTTGWRSNLSLALRVLGELSGDAGVLREAVTAAADAVAATPVGHPDRAGYLSNLGIARLAEFERSGDRQQVDGAVAAARDALDAAEAGHPDRLGYAANLSNALHSRWQRFGARGDLDEAVERIRAVVAATPTGHGDLARYRSNLAGALHARYADRGELNSLDEAIEAGRAAVAATPPDHPQLPVVQHNLGNALQARFERAANGDDLAEAVRIGREAVALTAPGQGVGAMVRGGLANALALRHAAVGDVASLREAIDLLRSSIAATPHDHPDRAGRLSNLAVALTTLHERTGEPGPLDDAIDAARRAVAAAGGDDADRATMLYVLGNAMGTRQQDLTDVGGVTAVVDVFRAATHAATSPMLRARAGAAWGRLAAAAVDPADGSTGLAVAVSALALVAPRDLARGDQEHRLTQLAGIASDAAAAAVARRDLDGAVALLEQGRGILLGQALDIRVDLADLYRDEPALARRFDELRAALDSGAAPGPRASAAELDRLVERIRHRRGFGGFLRPPPAAELRAAAAGGPVVLVNVSDLGSHALVVTPGGVDAVALPDLGPGIVAAQEARLAAAVGDALAAAPPSAARGVAEAEIAGILEWLWDVAAGPVLDALAAAGGPGPGRVWWSATGPLALLPLHAAGHHRAGDGRTALDRAVSSYTPTLRALAHARRPVPAGAGGCLVVGAVDDSDPLPGTRAEAGLLARLLPLVTTRVGPAVSSGEVLSLLPSHRWAHIACHARADPAHPSESRIELPGGDRLSVADVSRLRLDGAELAYLSACATARTGPALADEAIHLASAFQLAGYRQVVATLWPLVDRPAVHAARHVYGATAAGGGAATPHAVRSAALAQRRRWPAHPSVWATTVHAGA